MFRPLIFSMFLGLLAPLAQTKSTTVDMPGGRYYVIDLPVRSAGAPMILGLHGGGGNPAQFARNSGLTRPATAAGYAVIYPAGTARGRLKRLTWNGGYCCGHAARARVDDVAFLDAVIADASKRFGLNGNAVYLTGMSNGAIMAEWYGATRPDRVKAVAGVSGTMDVARTRIKGPVALLHIHGTADENVPYEGGQGSAGVTDTDFASVADVIGAFVHAAGVKLTKTSRILVPGAEGARVLEDSYTSAAGRVMVRLITIEGGGHEWPNGRRAGPGKFDANAEILRFFAANR